MHKVFVNREKHHSVQTSAEDGETKTAVHVQADFELGSLHNRVTELHRRGQGMMVKVSLIMAFHSVDRVHGDPRNNAADTAGSCNGEGVWFGIFGRQETADSLLCMLIDREINSRAQRISHQVIAVATVKSHKPSSTQQVFDRS